MISRIDVGSHHALSTPVFGVEKQRLSAGSYLGPDKLLFSGRKQADTETPGLGRVQVAGIPLRGVARLAWTLPSMFKNLGGYPLDKERLKQHKAHWKTEIQQRLDSSDVATVHNFGADIPVVSRVMSGFEIPDWTGLPPSVKWREENKKPTTCNGALAMIVLHLLEQLPPAHDVEEAVSQLDQLLRQVSDGAAKQGKKLTGEKTRSEKIKEKIKEKITKENPEESSQAPVRTDLKQAGYINKGGYSVAAVRGKAWSTVQTRHLTILAPNGAIQVLQMPDFKTMADIIRHDDLAQQSLNNTPVLSSEDWGYYPYAGHLNAAETIRLLEDEASGKIGHRVHELSDWTDVHTLMRDMPLDVKKQIAEGRLNVVFDKPGADGKRVGDADLG